jgi:hypothetical protein
MGFTEGFLCRVSISEITSASQSGFQKTIASIVCLSLYISDKKLSRDTVAKVLLNRGPRLPQNRRRPFVRIETTAALRRRRAIGCLVLVLSMPLTSSYTLSGLPGLASVLRTPSGETQSLLWSLLQKPCCSSTYQTVFSRLLRVF